MTTSTLMRMKNLGVSQAEMVVLLRERGVHVNPPELSNILRGIYVFPKSIKVLAECEKVLANYERTPR